MTSQGSSQVTQSGGGASAQRERHGVNRVRRSRACGATQHHHGNLAWGPRWCCAARPSHLTSSVGTWQLISRRCTSRRVASRLKPPIRTG